MSVNAMTALDQALQAINSANVALASAKAIQSDIDTVAAGVASIAAAEQAAAGAAAAAANSAEQALNFADLAKTQVASFNANVATAETSATEASASAGAAASSASAATESAAASATAVASGLAGKADAAALSAHVANQSNPHNVTAAQVGLDKVVNLAPIDLPVSSATSQAISNAIGALTAGSPAALDTFVQTYNRFLTDESAASALNTLIAAVKGEADSHIANQANPHGVTAAQVGLGSVADLTPANMPVSTATSEAISNAIGGVPSILICPSYGPDSTGTTRFAQVARPLSAYYGDMVDLLNEVGPYGDIGPVINARAVQYPGRPILVKPHGSYFNLITPINVGGPELYLLGVGSGSGPGPGSTDNTYSSAIVVAFGGTDAITHTSNIGTVVRGIRFDVQPQFRTGVGSGSMLTLSGPPGSTMEKPVVDGCSFNNRDVLLNLVRTGQPVVSNNYFGTWSTAGIKVSTTSSNEGSGGSIYANTLFGETLGGAGILDQCGYTDIFDNFIGGGAVGVHVGIALFAAGNPKIVRNVLEDHSTYGVLMETADGNPCSMVQVLDNEFSIAGSYPNFVAHIGVAQNDVSPGTSWLESLAIRSNVFRSTLAANQRFILVQSCEAVRIDDNDMILLGGAGGGGTTGPVGVYVVGGTTNAEITPSVSIARNNRFLIGFQSTGAFANRYVCAAGALQVNDEQPTTFARLGTDYYGVAPGSSAWVSDGTPGATLAGGGTGARAILRSNGTWGGL